MVIFSWQKTAVTLEKIFKTQLSASTRANSTFTNCPPVQITNKQIRILELLSACNSNI